MPHLPLKAMPGFIPRPKYGESPIPHLLLLPPFEEYCLTGFLPSDILQIPSIINHPEVSLTMGYPGVMDAELGRRYYDELVSTARDWPFSGERSCIQFRMAWR